MRRQPDMTTRELPSKEHLVKQFREDALVEAARQILASEGFDAITIERVADLAGIAKGTVYLYFKSKDELIRAAITATFQAIHAHVSAAAESAGPLLRDKLLAMLRTQYQQLALHQSFFRSLMAERRHLPQPQNPRDPVLARLNEYLTFLSSLIELGKRTGEVRSDIDSTEAAFLLIYIFQGNGTRHLIGLAPGPIGAEVESLVDFFLNGIGHHGD